MALSGPVLANLIVDNIKGSNPDLDAASQAKLLASWTQVANAIVQHITTSGMVTVNGVTGTGSPTGPFPILNQPGIIS